jgi:endo-alpha-N-acetylgalactosaminidase
MFKIRAVQKRFIGLFMSVLMIISYTPVSIFAEDISIETVSDVDTSKDIQKNIEEKTEVKVKEEKVVEEKAEVEKPEGELEKVEEENSEESNNQGMYNQDYNGKTQFEFKILTNKANFNCKEGFLELTNTGDLRTIDTKTTKIADGEIEVNFTVPDETLGRFGVLVRSIDANDWLLVGNDGIGWGVNIKGKWDFNTKSQKIFKKNDIVKMRIRYEGKKITIWAAKEGENFGLPILSKEYNFIPITKGHQGYRKWYTNVTTKIDYMHSGVLDSINGEPQGIKENKIIVQKDKVLVLPSKVKVVYSDGALIEQDVKWDNDSVDTSQVGTIQVTGTIEGMSYKPTINVQIIKGIVTEVSPIEVNLIKDNIDKTNLPKNAFIKLKISDDNIIDTISNIKEWSEITVNQDNTFTATGTLQDKLEDDSFATVQATGKIIDKSKGIIYNQEYTSPEGITWDTIVGAGRYDIDKTKGELNVINNDNSNYVIIENESPSLANGEFSATMTSDEAANYGIIFRAVDSMQYVNVVYLGGTNWAIKDSNNINKFFTGPSIDQNETVTIKGRYLGSSVKIIIKDKVCFNETVENLTVKRGKVGYSSSDKSKTLKVTQLRCGEIGTIVKDAIPQITKVEKIEVETYPRVIPKLKSELDIEYYGGIRGTSAVSWDYISVQDIKANNILNIGGIVDTIRFENLAKINVLSKEPRSYTLDFNDKDTATQGWQIGSGTGTISATEDGRLLISGLRNKGTAIYKTNDIPALKNLIFEADVEFVLPNENSVVRGGPLVRYIDATNWACISNDLSNLVWKNGQGYGKFPGTFTPEKNKIYHMVLKAHNGNFSISYDGKEIGKKTLSSLPDVKGYIGFHSWAGQSFIIDNVKVTEIPPLAPPQIDEKTTIISSDIMDVTVDCNFPRVLKYKWNKDGTILNGEDEQLFIMELNSEEYIPTITSRVLEDKSSIIYTMKNFGDTGIELEGKMTVIGNKLRFEITNIVESEVKFKSLNIPKQSLASVNTSENGKVASVLTTGDWNNIIEEFKTVEGMSEGVKGKTYAFISNNKFAVSVDSNVTTGGSRISISTDNRVDIKKTGIGAGAWTYREELGKADTGADYFQQHKPWVQVAIAKDENKDGKIDWQDAAILYRKDMKIPFGAESIKNNISYVSMNIGYTQNPFLKGLDMIKNIYNYTDGFGQIVLEKGYQAEGHDDSHPDYDHFGIRQGGIKDFNKLIEAGKSYNAKIGIHINATEYHPDAFQYPKNIVNINAPGWGWLDKAYYVDMRKDITTGELFRRLDLLKEAAPELNFVYVDVYTGNDWNASQLGEKVNSLGYMLGTEMNGPLEQYVTWTHWGGDSAYPNKGNNSNIMRFIKYNTQDTFVGHPLLKGNKHLLPGGWGNQQTVIGEMGTGIFYNNNLLTKYMQHFEKMKMTTNKIECSEGVKVLREGENINYYKNDRLIATTPENTYNDIYIGKTKIFLPWNPNADDGDEITKIDKIYAWTPFEKDVTQWTLPLEWKDKSVVKLYRLDDLGRHYVKDISVENGKITLSLNQNTPYIIVQEDIEEKRLDSWGEGQLIVDPGFNAQGFINDKAIGAAWEKKGENVSIVKEIEGEHEGSPRGGNDIVKITDGKGGISQEIHGLESGKTYSISTWIQNNDSREVTLNVQCGGKDYSTTITRKGKKRSGQAVKFKEDTFLRAKVEFTVPKEVTSATVSIDVSDGKGIVYIDDFKCWEAPGTTSREGYVFYEDFENVDEGISPFLLSPGRNNSNRSHLAEKDLYGRQYMNWVINGRFSLKSNQQDGETGEILITEDGTFKLKPNTTYELGLTYALARKDLNYSFNIKQTEKQVIAKIPLKVTGSSNNIEEIDRGIAKKVKTTFTTDENVDGLYMALEKSNGKEQIILDDIYIKEIKNEKNPTLEFVNLNTSVNEINKKMKTIPFNVNLLLSDGNNVDMSKAKIFYEISDPTILTVADGKIKPIKEGITQLKASVTVGDKTVSSNPVTMIVNSSKENLLLMD